MGQKLFFTFMHRARNIKLRPQLGLWPTQSGLTLPESHLCLPSNSQLWPLFYMGIPQLPPGNATEISKPFIYRLFCVYLGQNHTYEICFVILQYYFWIEIFDQSPWQCIKPYRNFLFQITKQLRQTQILSENGCLWLTWTQRFVKNNVAKKMCTPQASSELHLRLAKKNKTKIQWPSADRNKMHYLVLIKWKPKHFYDIILSIAP